MFLSSLFSPFPEARWGLYRHVWRRTSIRMIAESYGAVSCRTVLPDAVPGSRGWPAPCVAVLGFQEWLLHASLSRDFGSGYSI
ncbi:unnamed protein product, partial [Musa textilis]